MTRILFAALFAGGLVACNTSKSTTTDTTATEQSGDMSDRAADAGEDMADDADDMADDTMDAAGDMADDMDMPEITADNVSPSMTLHAADMAGGLTSLEPETAVAVIDAWLTKLNGVPGGRAIQSDLRTLKTQLTASTIDGMAVSQTLTKLGMATQAVAGTDTEIRRLGGALDQAGRSLGN